MSKRLSQSCQSTFERPCCKANFDNIFAEQISTARQETRHGVGLDQKLRGAFPALWTTSMTREKADDHHDDGKYQKQVDEAAGYPEEQTAKPAYDKNCCDDE
jgi:hypothetical protein